MKLLKDILIEGENQYQSFFENTKDSLEIAKTLVAFSNCEGGVLLIGLKKNGKIIGINPEEELLQISIISKERCEPNIALSSRVIMEGFRLLLEVFIFSGEVKPYKLINGSKKEIFLRKDKLNIIANRITEKIWKYLKKNNEKPIILSDNEVAVYDFIKKNPKTSLTKIYKMVDLSMGTIDFVLVRLISWDIIFMNLTEKGSEFSSENYLISE